MTSVYIHWKREVGSCPECREFFDISLIFDNKCPICDSYVDESNIVVTKIPATSAISEERIAGATIISGKNQPFGCVQLYLTKNLFSTDEEGKWDAPNVKNGNYRPSIEVGVSTVDVEAYGEVKGYIISNVSTDDDHTIIIAYHPAYRLSHTLISSVFSNLLTVKSVSENYAEFNVGLEGYSDSYNIPNDWYRADSKRGCQDKYDSGFPENTNNLNSEYKATGSSMINLSKYTSGRGYLGTSDSAKNKYTFWYQKDFVNLIFHIIVEDISKEGEDEKYVRTIEWVEGRPDDIIRFIVKEALNMDIYPQHFSEPKTYYPKPDSDSPSIKDDVYSDYTEEVLEKALAEGTKSMNATTDVFGTPIGHDDGDYTDRLRIRVNASITCGGLIDSIANLTNRKYSFSGEGFFMTDNVPNSSATKYAIGENGLVSEDTVINTTEGLLLDFDGEKEEDFDGTTVKAEPVSHSPEIQDNMDSIVISSQSVESENYAVNIPNTSAVGSKEGTRIILPIVDMGDDSTSDFNSYRNRMTKLCAYNTLVRRFKYDTNISYHISELTYEGPTADKEFTDYEKYNDFKDSTATWDASITYKSGQSVVYDGFIYISLTDNNIGKNPASSTANWKQITTGNHTEYITILYDDGIVAEKRKWSGEKWEIVNLTEDTGITPRYSSNSFVKEIRDNFNGLVIKDVPLAYIIRSYPEYMTELLWGRAPTNDLSAHIKQQESESASNSTSGNEDTGISNKYSSKLVVGNMTQKQLTENNDTRAGYTGLIMEKNVGSELYRLAGYNKGELQAYFNSQGEIMSGNDKVKINKDGITIGSGGGTIDSEVTRVNTRVKDWDNSTEYEAGDLVSDPDSGKTYKALKSSTNKSPSANPDSWQLLTYTDPGISVWNSSSSYVEGQLVLWDTITYEAISASNNKRPGTADGATYWRAKDESVRPWSGFKTYKVGDIVIRGNLLYTSLKDDNYNIEPSSSTTHWKLTLNTDDLSGTISTNKIVFDWNGATSYKVGDIVIYDKLFYTALKANTNKIPKTNTTDWKHTVNTGDLSGTISTNILEGEINAANNKVKSGRTIIDEYGLSTYDSNNTKVCYVGTDGNIQGIKINASQITAGTISADRIKGGALNISNGAVILDGDGLKAGDSNIRLNGEGLSIIYNPNLTGFREQNALTFVNTGGSDVTRLYVTNESTQGPTTILRSYNEVGEYSQLRLFATPWSETEVRSAPLNEVSWGATSWGVSRFFEKSNGDIISERGTISPTNATTIASYFSSSFSSIDNSPVKITSPNADHSYAIFELSRGIYGAAPGVLPGTGGWAISLMAECGDRASGGWTLRPLDVRVRYIGLDSDAVYSTDWTTIYGPSQTHTFNLEGLPHSGFKNISLQFRYSSSRNEEVELFVYEAKLHYKSDVNGGEIRISPYSTSLLGNVNINGRLDGSFVIGSAFETSLKRLFNTLYVSDIKLSGYTTGTWYENDEPHPMMITFTNGSNSGSIELRDIGNNSYKVAEGNVYGNFVTGGWNSYTTICPSGWSFKFNGGDVKRYFTCLLRI